MKKYYINEPDVRSSGSILITDDENNDISEFYHNEHATVTQTYEEALFLAELITKNRR